MVSGSDEAILDFLVRSAAFVKNKDKICGKTINKEEFEQEVYQAAKDIQEEFDSEKQPRDGTFCGGNLGYKYRDFYARDAFRFWLNQKFAEERATSQNAQGEGDFDDIDSELYNTGLQKRRWTELLKAISYEYEHENMNIVVFVESKENKDNRPWAWSWCPKLVSIVQWNPNSKLFSLFFWSVFIVK